MATFVEHTACQRCGSSDACAHYSDGGWYCFSCGASSRATRPGFVEADEKAYTLPDDLSHEFPESVVQLIAPTGLTIAELIKNGYYYSQQTRRLYRLLGDGCCECRRLGGEHSGPKSQFFGSKSKYDGIVVCRTNSSSAPRPPNTTGRGPNANIRRSQDQVHEACSASKTNLQLQQEGLRPRGLCIVEDSLSAIKCARHIDCVPLFGSSVQNDKLARLIKGYDNVYVWLDADKFTTAQSIAVRAQLLGANAKVIYTELDPKYLNADEFI